MVLRPNANANANTNTNTNTHVLGPCDHRDMERWFYDLLRDREHWWRIRSDEL
jgi:hypothetical protein